VIATVGGAAGGASVPYKFLNLLDNLRIAPVAVAPLVRAVTAGLLLIELAPP